MDYSSQYMEITSGIWAKNTFACRDRMKIDGLDRMSEKNKGCFKIVY